jgi:hypothetical protein
MNNYEYVSIYIYVCVYLDIYIYIKLHIYIYHMYINYIGSANGSDHRLHQNP